MDVGARRSDTYFRTSRALWGAASALMNAGLGDSVGATNEKEKREEGKWQSPRVARGGQQRRGSHRVAPSLAARGRLALAALTERSGGRARNFSVTPTPTPREGWFAPLRGSAFFFSTPLVIAGSSFHPLSRGRGRRDCSSATGHPMALAGALAAASR